MNRVIHAPENARFYDRTGQVILETPTADGKKMTKPTIRHARKHGWLPSFSNVNKDLSKPHLEAWKTEQIIRVLLATEREVMEDDDNFIKRCVKLSGEATGMYADRGNEIHAQLGEYFGNGVKPQDPACIKAADQVEVWLKGFGIEEVQTETSFANLTDGYAGTSDISGTGQNISILADYKSTDLSKYKKPYMENGIQLVSYRRGREMPSDTRLFTIPIDRDTGECKFIEWNSKSNWSHQELWDMWLHMLGRWRIANKHDPRLECNT